jgi:hypothetical protein
MSEERDYAFVVDTFKRRSFTGADVLAITDFLGVGVGATMMAAARLDTTREALPTEADYDDPPRT